MLPPLRLSKAGLPGLALVAAAALFGASNSAYAANLVADPGFESAGTGSPAGSYEYVAGQSIDGGSWNVVNIGSETASTVLIDNYASMQDPYQAFGSSALNLTLGALVVSNTISQTISTVAGTAYTLSFYADADARNTFSATVNGVTVSGTPSTIAQNGFPGTGEDSNQPEFTLYTGTFTALSTSSVLDLTASASPSLSEVMAGGGSVDIDNVSVTAASSAPTVTPEPASFALVLTGLAGLGEAIRRRGARSV